MLTETQKDWKIYVNVIGSGSDDPNLHWCLGGNFVLEEWYNHSSRKKWTMNFVN